METRGNETSLQRLTTACAEALVGVITLPAIAVSVQPVNGGPSAIIGALTVAVLPAIACLWLVPRTRLGPVWGSLALVVAVWLLGYVSYPGAAFAVALPLGVGGGLAAARPGSWRRWCIPALFSVAVALVFVFSAVLALCFTGLLALAAVISLRDQRAGALAPRVASLAAAFAAAFAVVWVGSTAPAVTWFGALTSHGPRNSDMVAVTFDDGPNGQTTLDVAALLDSHGVKGTFFEVGKAVKDQPEITRQLIADGHTVGNHSYYHDATSFLYPRYPELQRAEAEIVSAAGVCPALFRPPHGTHTPFMSHVVDDAGMHLVNWDVSARDWVETDAASLTSRILSRVKPGSIILLHEGIDGNIGADRSVVLEALPAILDGLKARGLRAVTLDTLLNVSPYLSDVRCQRFRMSSGASASVAVDGVRTEASNNGQSIEPAGNLRRAVSPGDFLRTEWAGVPDPLRWMGVLPRPGA